MAFVDELRTARTESAAAQAHLEDVLTRMADALFARLRPLQALAWLSDAALRHCCRAFALAADEQDAAGNAATAVTPVETLPAADTPAETLPAE
jgi:hypothetical protein